ncbi:MAG: hypothetical protein ACP5N1_03370 [Candidatus Woesearchaeota archaeon]
MVEEIKRQTAYKCSIFSLVNGVFIKKQGWESSYLMTEYGDFSRVNILAVVVSKDDTSIVLDDGTGQISGRMFDNTEQMLPVVVGDVVIVIGRPRDFNNQTYLTIEIIKKISSSWVAYRKKELSMIQKIRTLEELPKVEKKILEPEIIETKSTLGSKDKIAQVIKALDKGEGANIEDVLKLSKVSDAEELISDMMMRGEIFELEAGYIKLM